MEANKQNIARLWERYLANQASPDEVNVLFDYIRRARNDDENVAFYKEAIQRFAVSDLPVFENSDIILQNIIEADEHLSWSLKTGTPVSNQSPVRHGNFVKAAGLRYPSLRTMFRWASAAAIVLLFGAGAYLWSTNRKASAPSQDSFPVTVKRDVPPGGNKATLTLSDGRKIILDDAANGQLANDGGSQLVKSSDGRIIYSPQPDRSPHVVYNTMSTPRGGQYQVLLPDGTGVWLNAASSITYPTVFTGKERIVTVSGEAYFEVKSNKEQPFIVKTRTDEITVLGTRFNINTYSDEEIAKTSLLEGAVKINEAILKPGQAYVNGHVIQTDIEQDIAWKNGIFNFNNVTVQEAMRQLARWYDITIVYDRPVNETFIGKVGRNLTLEQVLKTLDGLGVHFKLEGTVLHVFP